MLLQKHFGGKKYQNKLKPQGFLPFFICDGMPCHMPEAEVTRQDGVHGGNMSIRTCK